MLFNHRFAISICTLLFLYKFTPMFFHECPHRLIKFEQSQNFSSFEESPYSTALNYSFIEDSKDCDTELLKNFYIQPLNDYRLCPNGTFSVDLSPHTIFPDGTNILPYITLNISIDVVVPTEKIFIQFHCQNAPNKDDYLCHNTKIQLEKWGRMIRPCRLLKLPYSRITSYNFSYSCYRLFGLSHYALDFFLWPNACRLRIPLILTIPNENQLEPKILEFYKAGEITNKYQLDWSPLVFVDLSKEDGIQINFRASKLISLPRIITISIFENLTETKELVFLHKEQIPGEKNWFWSDVSAGNYSLFIYVDRSDCHLSCTRINEHCDICPYTQLNFEVTEDKFSGSKNFLLVAKWVALIIIALLFITVIILVTAFLYVRVWRPRQVAQLPPQSIEMRSRPTVLLLYTDDCHAHTDTVLALARLLDRDGNIRCLVDQLEFAADPNIRPSVWLVNKIATVDFILIIFSECSCRVLSGEKLIQRRPFPDLFNTAIGFVLTKINESLSSEGILSNVNRLRNNSPLHRPRISGLSKISSLKKFIVARFTYSSPQVLPEFFASPHFGPFILPVDVGKLFARLHRLEDPENGGLFEHSADLTEIQTAIRQFETFSRLSPDWVEGRFEPKAEKIRNENANDNEMSQTKNIFIVNQAEVVPSVIEQEKLAEKFGLLQPDEEEERDDQALENTNVSDTGFYQPSNMLPSTSNKYQLIGRPEDFCSSSEEEDS